MRLVALLLAAALAGCEGGKGSGGAASPIAFPFVDVAVERGLIFRHDDGALGERTLPETMGGGGGFLDYDQDGDLDIALIDCGPLAEGAARPLNRLFANDGAGRFTDVTEASGFGDNGRGMGLAVGDIDNDGDPDVYVTNFGENVLLVNRGDGTFARATPEAARIPTWSVSATFLDHDRDGALDLYVVSYLDVTLATHRRCERGELHVYCSPRDYPPEEDHLLRGDGRGGFTDISAESGIRVDPPGRGLGVLATDFDDDGDDDLYVANDMDLNFLFVNSLESGSARFREDAVLLGCAASEDGRPEAGMGVDSGDFDGDGDFDLVVTNFEEQTNSIYRNDGGAAFTESSYHVGLGAVSLPFLGFGVRFFDHDLDGDLDLYVANGHVFDNAAEMRQGSLHAQADQLFENRGGKFVDVLAPAVAAGAVPALVGRAAASGDIDDDGDLDLLVVNNGGPAMLLENRASRDPPRLGLRLEGTPPSNRDAYGAKVTIESSGTGGAPPLRQVFEVRAGSSYLASHDPRIVAAVPGAESARVAIRWPSGRTETLEAVPAGAYHHIVEGEGIRASRPFRR